MAALLALDSHHPPLRCLALEVDEEYQKGLVAQLDALLELAHRRPGLRLRTTRPAAGRSQLVPQRVHTRHPFLLGGAVCLL